MLCLQSNCSMYGLMSSRGVMSSVSIPDMLSTFSWTFVSSTIESPIGFGLRKWRMAKMPLSWLPSKNGFWSRE